jgi:hypothetical protein
MSAELGAFRSMAIQVCLASICSEIQVSRLCFAVAKTHLVNVNQSPAAKSSPLLVHTFSILFRSVFSCENKAFLMILVSFYCAFWKQIPRTQTSHFIQTYYRVQLLSFWTSIVLFLLFKTRRFGDRTLSPSLSKSLFSWAQSIRLVYLWTPAPSQERICKPNTT